jgi:hypothetical protein
MKNNFFNLESEGIVNSRAHPYIAELRKTAKGFRSHESMFTDFRSRKTESVELRLNVLKIDV